LLQRRSDVSRPSIEAVAGASRLTTLLGNVSASFAPQTQSQRAQELERLGQIAATVPVRRLVFPDGVEQLAKVRLALLRDVDGGC
jgi:hypothetical protein